MSFALGGWLVIVVAWLAWEGIGFTKADDGWPTFSQIIKEWKRKSPLRRHVLTFVLLAGGPILYAHWVVEWF